MKKKNPFFGISVFATICYLLDAPMTFIFEPELKLPYVLLGFIGITGFWAIHMYYTRGD